MALDFSTLPQRFANLRDLEAGSRRGKALERLVGEMFSALPGVKVANTNAVSGSGDAEFDILLTNEMLEDGLPGFDRDVLVECKSSTEKLGARDVTHFLHQAEMRSSRWSVLVSLAGITGDGSDLRAANQVVSHFATRKVWLMVLVEAELVAIRSAEHLAAVIELKRTDNFLKLRPGELTVTQIRNLDPKRGGLRFARGVNAFRRAVEREQDQALGLIFEKAVENRGRIPRERASETELLRDAREALRRLEAEYVTRRAQDQPDPFYRDIYERSMDVGAAFACLLDEDLGEGATLKSLSFDVRVTAPQRLRAHTGTELWRLLSEYRLEQVMEHDGHERRSNVLAMLAMVVEELLAIHEIDPRDVYGYEDPTES